MTNEQGATRRRRRGSSRVEALKLLAAALLGALAVLFAVLNLEDVEVNWLVNTFQTPLIVVILAAFGLGLLVGGLAARRGR